MMRRGVVVLFALLALGCSTKRVEPERRITPGSRIIYNSGVGDTIWAVCDKGNLIYMTEKTPAMSVVPNGCPGGQP